MRWRRTSPLKAQLGRGPPFGRAGRPPRAGQLTPTPAFRAPAASLGPLRIGMAIAVVAGALLAAWTEWQPQRSVEASEQAVALIKQNPQAALRAAQAGVERDPLSAVALFRLSAVEHAIGESALARATLQKAVQMQPSNPETWLTLGEYDLKDNPRAAVGELRAAVYLNPESIAAQNAYVQALRATPRRTQQRAGRVSQAMQALRYGQAARASRPRRQLRIACAERSPAVRGVRAATHPRS